MGRVCKSSFFKKPDCTAAAQSPWCQSIFASAAMWDPVAWAWNFLVISIAHTVVWERPWTKCFKWTRSFHPLTLGTASTRTNGSLSPISSIGVREQETVRKTALPPIPWYPPPPLASLAWLPWQPELQDQHFRSLQPMEECFTWSQTYMLKRDPKNSPSIHATRAQHHQNDCIART